MLPGRLSWPSVRDRSNFVPAAPGPLQSLGLRVQRYTHAAFALSLSSSPGVALYSAQPQDQIELSFSSLAPCVAASACSLTVSNHAVAGRRPSRPPDPLVVWKPRNRPSFEVGIPSRVRSSIARRNELRSVLLPSTGPCLEIRGAGKYTSRTIPATWATARHQSPASPAVYGVLLTSSHGCPPRSCSRVRKWRTFARYCVVVGDHGEARPAP